uniref:ER membrane protein complex subunit 2 n=1 Tax=Chlamydomonas euryale TaxID=1486919 RepID=A0A7R9VEW4_9CHLO|mmetsp:Transcript_32424/g.96816  ORF Transcript_32424/g.96816 Transcript_32424/m.96816 type:complete len:300 (+) Transcript_32424:94-993(+)
MSSGADLEDAERELIACKTRPSKELLQRYMRVARDTRIRDSEPVAKYGSMLLKHYKTQLGEEELWVVHEQTAIAMLDAGAVSAAQPLIKAVAVRFPNAQRTNRLQGMYFEAGGDLDTAVGIYKDALTRDPTAEMFHKRLVAVEKTRGNAAAAVDALRKYLETFSADREGWEELAELYVEMGMLKQALFCYEELIMMSPTASYLVRYADVLYTLGQYRMARSYYAKAIEMSSGRSARALFGVLQCYANITEKVALQDSRTRAQIELPDLTADVLISMYRKHAPDKLPLLEPMLKAQGLLQ